MSNVLAKVKSALGLGEYEDYEEYENDDIQEEEEEEVGIEPVIQGNKRNAKVVNLHTAVSPKVTVVKPLAYEQATEISDALKDKKIVVVNTTALENRIAQRLLDFISGSCYALCGELQEVEKGVYLLAPSNVEVSNDLKNELSSKAFSWSK
ncbi:MAG: cell division protein SepF [Clostridium sp.]|uniref:cell division protein SepF n=1 Tax=Clostridium sp. DSM 8431 TaxID=1761781 RepID=UPI0008E82ADC|nr:cell division protein SepF [Clostridium sp. DSM 8431]MCR4943381.1 cell division protein SepF [Clostridium sp.]SFU28506.1 cell division inhibitor SepF [Clostridium sp. DSM 8431]